MNSMAVLIMGSESDLADAIGIEEKLVGFKVPVTRHILSAHRNTAEVLKIIPGYDQSHSPLVYMALVGKKPDLGPVIAGNTDNPVAAYVKMTEPGGFYTHHLLSALDTPPGISLAVFSDPTNAALYVAKIIGMQDDAVRNAVNAYRTSKAASNVAADGKYSSMELPELKASVAKK